MRHKGFIETDLEILKLLGEEREYCQYDMPNRLHISYRTAMRRLSELENIGLVKVARKEPSKTRGKKRKIYMLTFKGVVTYLAFISLEPVKLYVIGGENKEDIARRIAKDRKRYLEEAGRLVDFLEFYGKQLNYAIFKQIPWLVPRFPVKTESPILSYVLETAKLAKSYSPPSGRRTFVRQLRSEISGLKKQEKQLKRYPQLRKITLFQKFGKGEEEKIEVDLYAQTVERLRQKEKSLETMLTLENKAWKLWFAERFFERIAHLPPKGKTRNEVLHRYASDLLEGKKKREIAALEKIVNLFS